MQCAANERVVGRWCPRRSNAARTYVCVDACKIVGTRARSLARAPTVNEMNQDVVSMRKNASVTTRRPRALLIIDGGYFHKGQRSLGFDLDVASLIRFVENRLNVSCVDMYYYDSTTSGADTSRDAFHRALRRLQIRVELRPLKSMAVHCPNRRCKHARLPIKRRVQAGVDVAIATKILTEACENRFDALVLLAGDGDFADAVRYVKENRRRRVHVVGFRESISNRLAPYAEREHGVLCLNDFVAPEE